MRRRSSNAWLQSARFLCRVGCLLPVSEVASIVSYSGVPEGDLSLESFGQSCYSPGHLILTLPVDAKRDSTHFTFYFVANIDRNLFQVRNPPRTSGLQGPTWLGSVGLPVLRPRLKGKKKRVTCTISHLRCVGYVTASCTE